MGGERGDVGGGKGKGRGRGRGVGGVEGRRGDEGKPNRNPCCEIL